MRTKETNSFSFYSSDLNKLKFDKFVEKATHINIYKNKVSEYIHNNFSEAVNLTKFDIIKKFGNKTNTLYTSEFIRSEEYQKAVGDVLETYQNKITQVRQKITFKIQKSTKVEYYKRIPTKVKSYKIIHTSTDLCKTLTFLSKYGYIGITGVISNKTDDFSKKMYYYLTKFSEDRLLKLAFAKRDRLFKQYNQTAHNFKTLSYRSAIRVNVPLIQSTKEGGYTKFVVCIPSFNSDGKGVETKPMIVPISYAYSYHGHINQYKSKEYTVVFENNRIRIVTTKKVEKEYITGNVDSVGVDTNVKHNMFSTSLNTTVDYDRELIKEFSGFLAKTDKKLDDKKRKKLTKGEIKQQNVYKRRIKHEIQKKCALLADECKNANKNHLIIEDLSLLDRCFSRNEEFNGLKYSRLTRELHLSLISKILTGICQKKVIQLTIIPSHYTSQLCLKCGCIHRDNRKTQEEFKCIQCGHTDNADNNSANNILFIGQSDVLIDLFLEADTKTSWLVPKKFLKKEFIRASLEDHIVQNLFQDVYI